MWVWSVVYVHVTVGMHAFVCVSVECDVCACHCVCVRIVFMSHPLMRHVCLWNRVSQWVRILSTLLDCLANELPGSTYLWLCLRGWVSKHGPLHWHFTYFAYQAIPQRPPISFISQILLFFLFLCVSEQLFRCWMTHNFSKYVLCTFSLCLVHTVSHTEHHFRFCFMETNNFITNI